MEIEKKFGEQVVKELAKNLNGSPEVIIRTGEALKPHDPEKVLIRGVIESPFVWLEKRKDTIDQGECSVIVNRDDMEIGLRINEHDFFSDTIYGNLTLSQEFKKFGINSGDYITGLELSDLIRMNRSCFADKAKAMELVTIMRNFKGTVTREIEASDDKKGNRLAYVRQVVEGNQPPSFELCIPIFKGQPKQSFTVEIDIDPDTLKGTLVSPDAKDIIDEKRDELMDDVIVRIAELCPSIPIIEV